MISDGERGRQHSSEFVEGAGGSEKSWCGVRSLAAYRTFFVKKKEEEGIATATTAPQHIISKKVFSFRLILPFCGYLRLKGSFFLAQL